MMMGEYVKGEGPVKEKEVSVESFDSVTAGGSYDTEIVLGDEERVVISAQENLLELFEPEVKGGKLTIKSSKGFSTNESMKVTVYAKQVKHVGLAGSGDLRMKGIDQEELSANISGSGDVDLEGKAERVDLSVAGSGGLDAVGLSAEEVSASISGSGFISCKADENLDASIAGSGSVIYSGDPEVKKSISGSGSVRRS